MDANQIDHKLDILSRYLIAEENIDRKIMASDLHDGPLQTLGLCLSKIKNKLNCGHDSDSPLFAELKEYIEDVILDMCQVMEQLYPQVLNHGDIEKILMPLMKEFNTEFQSNIKLVRQTDAPLMIDKNIIATLYCFIRELMLLIVQDFNEKDVAVQIDERGSIGLSFRSDQKKMNPSDFLSDTDQQSNRLKSNIILLHYSGVMIKTKKFHDTCTITIQT